MWFNFMRLMAQEVRELMAKLGFRTLSEMVGRVDKLETRRAVDHFKAKGLDFSQIFHQPEVPDTVGRYCRILKDHGLDKALDNTTLLALCKAGARGRKTVSATLPIRNRHRVVGTIVGSELTRPLGKKRTSRRHHPAALPRLGGSRASARSCLAA